MKSNKLKSEGNLTISNDISNFKNDYRDNGRRYLLWGWMITFVFFSHYIIIKILRGKEAYDYLGKISIGIWIGSFISILIIQRFMERNIKMNKKECSLLDKYLKGLWMITGISIIPAMFISFKYGIEPPTIILIILGITNSFIGLIIRFRPLIIGGIAFFAFSMATTFATMENLFLLTGVAFICCYLIPAYLLKFAKE